MEEIKNENEEYIKQMEEYQKLRHVEEETPAAQTSTSNTGDAQVPESHTTTDEQVMLELYAAESAALKQSQQVPAADARTANNTDYVAEQSLAADALATNAAQQVPAAGARTANNTDYVAEQSLAADGLAANSTDYVAQQAPAAYDSDAGEQMSGDDSDESNESGKKKKKKKKEKKPKKPMSKGQRIFSTILLVFFIGVAVFSAYKLGTMLYDYWKLRQSNNKAVELAYNGEFTGIIDFEKLRAENPDVVAWLYHKDMGIDLPVVQTDNNDTYLSKRFDGTYGGGGTIFVDYQVTNPFNDFNTIIYGHHMKDGSMFACFKKFKDKDYGIKNQRFELITPDAKYHLDTVAFLNVASDDSIYTVNITTDDYKASYCNEIVSKASYTTGVEFGPTDRLVLMSTCAYEFENARWIIVGKLTPWTDKEIAKAEKLQKAKDKSEK